MRHGRFETSALLAVAAWLDARGDRSPPVVPTRVVGNNLLPPQALFLISGGDYRPNTIRPSPPLTPQAAGRLSTGRDVPCSEPSPDHATTISTLLGPVATGHGAAAASGSPSATA